MVGRLGGKGGLQYVLQRGIVILHRMEKHFAINSLGG